MKNSENLYLYNTINKVINEGEGKAPSYRRMLNNNCGRNDRVRKSK